MFRVSESIGVNFGRFSCKNKLVFWMQNVREKPSVVSHKFLYLPFVVSLSNHERNQLKILALRQAQGERSMSTY